MAPLPQTELRGKRAVVTGSSSGIGRAIALELAVAGVSVMVHAHRNEQAAHEVAATIRNLGGEATVVLIDLADPIQQAGFVETAWQWRSGVDYWVNNAGKDILTGEAADWSFDRKLEALWRVDVAATVRMSRLIGQRMKSSDGGVILNMGWDGVERGMAGDSGQLFAAVKGAVTAFSRSLAQSLAPEVRVNCLAPGWIQTAWGKSASAAWQNRAQRESLSQRWGTPRDVARVARFLLSPGAAFVSGQVVEINGGFNFSPHTDAIYPNIEEGSIE